MVRTTGVLPVLAAALARDRFTRRRTLRLLAQHLLPAYMQVPEQALAVLLGAIGEDAELACKAEEICMTEVRRSPHQELLSEEPHGAEEAHGSEEVCRDNAMQKVEQMTGLQTTGLHG